MLLIACPECGREVSDRATACVKCGHPIAPARSIGGPQFDKARALGYGGAALIAVGAFLPVLRAPILGTLNAMSGKDQYGLLFLAVACLSAIAISQRSWRTSLALGVFALGATVYLFVQLREKGDSPFVLYEYVFLVLMLGCALLVAVNAFLRWKSVWFAWCIIVPTVALAMAFRVWQVHFSGQ